MQRKIVDARSKPCPTPVIMTREAFEKLAVGEEMEILFDNDTARDNVAGFFASKGIAVTVESHKDEYRIIARNKRSLNSPQEEATKSIHSSGSSVICVKSDRMGIGDNDLGDVLIRAYLNILDQVQPLPSCIIFYNTGIRMALNNSPVIDSLRKLETLGVRILICGTCLNHFHQKDNIGAGTVSNMYDIAETLAGCSHVIYP